MTAVTCSSYHFFGQICHIPRNRDAKQLDNHVSEKMISLGTDSVIAYTADLILCNVHHIALKRSADFETNEKFLPQ